MEGAESCGSVSVTSEQESEEGEVMMMQEQDGGAAAAEAMAPELIDVTMDVALLHCKGCLLPLKPPVLKCEAAGNLVCCFCCSNRAALCTRGCANYAVLDVVLGDGKVPCPYKAFGCERYLVYHDVADHQRACRCAPCSCPEPGCGFVGSRATLLDHFAAGHQRPAVPISYGRAWNLSLSLAHRWHALVGDEDRSLFLVSLGPLGAVTAVSLLCVRPDGEAAAAPRFWSKLSVERPAGDGKDNLVLLASAVSSIALSTGAPVPEQGMFLAVPQELISGDTLMLSVRIDPTQPAAAGGAPKSATPQARTPSWIVMRS